MDIQFKESVAGYDESYRPGKVYSMDDKKAEKWVRIGLAFPVETADAKPVKEVADAKPKRETASRKPKTEVRKEG